MEQTTIHWSTEGPVAIDTGIADPPSDQGINKLHELLTTGRKYKISKRQMVQSSDERYRSLVNMVGEGYIKRYEIGNDGSISVQAIYGPGDIFPLTLVFKTLLGQDVYEGPEVVYYETITDAEIFSIDTDRLVEAVKNDSTLYKDLLFESGKRTNSNIQRLENISMKSAFRRTAHQLVYFARKFGETKYPSINIKVLLTHQDLADVLSLTRETVSINLRKLQDKKLIRVNRYIEVLNLNELEKVAYG